VEQNKRARRDRNSGSNIITIAIWHTSKYDFEVEIIKYLGRYDGDDWWLIKKNNEEGQTGVPQSELSDFVIKEKTK
jgi:hypothetical protein